MKWKFMFKFKNNILTLGASDGHVFNNLLRLKEEYVRMGRKWEQGGGDPGGVDSAR